MEENSDPTAETETTPTQPVQGPPPAPPAQTPTPGSPVNPWAPTPPAGWGTGQPTGSHWWGAPPGQAGGYGGGYGGPGGPVPPYGQPGWHWAPMPPAPRPARTALVIAIAAGVLVAAIAGGVVGHAIWNSSNSSNNGSPFGFSAPSQGTQPGPASGSPQDAQTIANGVDPGLVDVNTVIADQNAEGAGTGMVLTSTGEVLTNNHVVEGASKITVTDVGNGRTYNATVVGYDRSHDVAVLQLTGASGLPTVTTGNSSNVSAGQGVVAVGNAQGAGGTPSYAGGSVTAINQTITASDELDGSSEQLTGLIQTNADIVSGDSGGPLVNAQGRIIGMDTAAAGGFQFQAGGQGYAIPINTALNIAKQITSGKASSTVHIGPTALLGVAVQSSSDNGFGSSTPGATIVRLLSSGPAGSAGLVPGDIITSLGGTNVSSAEDLTNAMLTHKPGDNVTVGYVNTGGQQQTTTVTLATGPAQ